MRPALHPRGTTLQVISHRGDGTVPGPADWAPSSSSEVPTFSLCQKGEGCGPAAGVKIRKSEECTVGPSHLRVPLIGSERSH